MKLTTFLGSALVGASVVVQVTAMPTETEGNTFQKRAGSIAVTGVQGNGVQVRMEMRTMQRNQPDMWNLYLLGMDEFMKMDQADPRSYYQIAGIHGRPYNAWDGATSAAGSAGYGGGYCTHVSNLFLPWHRPYLALFEQELYKHVQNVANSFPAGSQRTRYQNAGRNFRIPYWDWAATPPCADCLAFPSLISNYYSDVDTPTGRKTIRNPLFKYDFHYRTSNGAPNDLVYNPFVSWTGTKRSPTTNDANANSQNNLINPVMQSARAGLADRIYQVFQNGNFQQVSNEAWSTATSSNSDSLESIHDAIHSITGGVGNAQAGHMTYLDYSAFDPVFFLHHAMIDRLYNMYQVVYPNSYVEPLAAIGATYTYPAGTNLDVNTYLAPFHTSASGGRYTSANSKTTSQFGYYYPETSGNANAASVRSYINTAYRQGAGTQSLVRAAKSKRDLIGDVATALDIQEAATGNSSSYQYSASIVSQKFAVGGSYNIFIFLGTPPTDSGSYGTAENLVGFHGVSANFHDPNVANAMAGMDVKVTGSVPLTSALINRINNKVLPDLKPDTVQMYLIENMKWRCVKADGTEVAISDVPDLSVTIVSAMVEPAGSIDQFPRYSHWAGLQNVTAGMAGGHSENLWKGKEDFTSKAKYTVGGYAKIGMNVGSV